MPARATYLNLNNLAPIVGVLVLGATWGRHLGVAPAVLVTVVLAMTVMSAVHHAEVVAHRVGEPFGSLILAVAVTIIEVALILTLMSSGSNTEELARDTVFAAVMISINGIVGACLLVASLKQFMAQFNPEGTGAALATVATLATLCLVLPSVTESAAGPVFTPGQLGFAAIASALLYGLFVFTQTVRHRDFFLPVEDEHDDGSVDADLDVHAAPPTGRQTLASLALLFVALVGVVGLAKVISKNIEDAVSAVGLPQAFVGVVIAILVLAPESIAAIRAALRRRVQVALNLAYGSAMASIGLTIPTLAIASIWIDTPLRLGLNPLQITLLAVSVVVGILTVVPGRAKTLQGGVHLALFAAFVALSISP